MKRFVWLPCVGLAVACAFAAGRPQPDYADRVLRLSVTYQDWNEFRPWAKLNPGRRPANAVLLKDRSLLTTAEMLRNATMIELEKRGATTCDRVRIVHLDADLNLALLAAECPGFVDDLEPVEFAGAAPSEGDLSAVRWKNGEIEVSPTRVSRVEVRETKYSSLAHPFLIATTNMEDGGRAEPVFAADELVGLAESQSERTLPIIPADLIQSYLRLARADGPYRGMAALGVEWQSGEDPALAAFLGLSGAPRGVVVTETPRGSSGCGALRPRDVLLSLDGYAIEATGFYEHPRYGRIRFGYIPADGHAAGDAIPAQVLRAGKTVELKVPLRREEAALDLIPETRTGGPPFVIAGGLVLRELDATYLRAWGRDWSKRAPMTLLALNKTAATDQQAGRRRVLILVNVLPSAFNLGYQQLEDLVITAINGRPVDTVSSAVEALRHPVDGFQRFMTAPGASPAEIVLDAERFEAATQEILATYRISERQRLTPELPDLGPPCAEPSPSPGDGGPAGAAPPH
ncbi:MAG: hypothetical protein LAO51_12665 [Acidobacteriia bacterium]|nr:hypothetical protein [Terriglobia bacterium]